MKLGDKVTCSAVYRRYADYSVRGGVGKNWSRWAYGPRNGIYIGTRTLSNGVRVWEGSEEGMSYTPKEYLRAALVVFSTREKPMLVPLDAITQEAE